MTVSLRRSMVKSLTCWLFRIFLVLAFTISSVSAQTGADSGSKPAFTINSQEELNQVLGRLEQPRTRLRALGELLRFAATKIYNRGGSTYYQTPNAKTNELQDQAAEAALKYTDFQTVSGALSSKDPELQFFGAWFCQMDSSQGPAEKGNSWALLVPKLEKLAVEGETRTRRVAVTHLVLYPGAKPFLQALFLAENSADVLAVLLRGLGDKQSEEMFTTAMIRILSDPDPAVRKDALAFIGGNANASPFWHIDFSPVIYTRVLELCGSQAAPERAAAAFALTDMRAMDADRTRRAFIKLADDPAVDVRWRVGFGLAGQFEHKEVKAVTAKLLKDPSSLVRYETILALGPKKYVSDLQKLARDSDSTVALGAAGVLQQIAQEKQKH